MTKWWVYVLLSCCNHTYVGIALDPEARLEQHNGLRKGGAKSTRRGRPWRIGCVYGPYEGRSQASKVEYQVKQLQGLRRLFASITE